MRINIFVIDIDYQLVRHYFAVDGPVSRGGAFIEKGVGYVVDLTVTELKKSRKIN